MPCIRHIDSSSIEKLTELHPPHEFRHHIPDLTGTRSTSLCTILSTFLSRQKTHQNGDRQGILYPRATDKMDGPGSVPHAQAQTGTPVDEPSEGLAGAVVSSRSVRGGCQPQSLSLQLRSGQALSEVERIRKGLGMVCYTNASRCVRPTQVGHPQTYALLRLEAATHAWRRGWIVRLA